MDFLTTSEAANYVRLGERKLYELVTEGAIPGSKVTGKIAMRYQPTARLTLRSAVSTGFRAPSLNQSYYSSVVTNFAADPNTGNPVPFEIGIFPVNSREARALGARPLKPESSRNFNAGFTLTPVEDLTFTSDVY